MCLCMMNMITMCCKHTAVKSELKVGLAPLCASVGFGVGDGLELQLRAGAGGKAKASRCTSVALSLGSGDLGEAPVKQLGCRRPGEPSYLWGGVYAGPSTRVGTD